MKILKDPPPYPGQRSLLTRINCKVLDRTDINIQTASHLVKITQVTALKLVTIVKTTLVEES